jgi:hypothetical protein
MKPEIVEAMAIPGPTKSMTVVAKSTGNAVYGRLSFFLS